MMKLTSSAFKHMGKIPKLHTCQGKEISPSLEFHHVPAGAKSLALIMDDPDVPIHVRKDQNWDHWVIFNIPPTTTHLLEGKKPPGILGSNTNGDAEYQGPCPPDKEHRYFFRLYALDTLLALEEGATKKEVLRAMQGHIITQAELIGLYQKD
jgi:Raf kinase inhibitor-like YbhB/YbcL family protein